MNILGKRIHDRREQLNLTQEQLGALIGKDQKQVWRYEAGKQQPTAEALIALARALETTTDYLLGESDVVRPVTNDNLDPLERETIELLRGQDPETRQKIMKAIKALV